MFHESIPSPTDDPTISNPSMPDSTKNKRFGKKTYVVTAAIVTIAIIAVALLIPQEASAIIPLEANYTIGEKMVYDVTATVRLSLGILNQSQSSEATATGQQTIEVLAFDGEYYTLNRTLTLTVNNRQFTNSSIERMAKTGYSSYMMNLNSTQNPTTSEILGDLTQLLNQPEVKAGDSVSIPYPGSGENSSITGGIKMTFKGVENLNSKAGTYRAFGIEVASDNLKMDLSKLLKAYSGSVNGSIGFDFNAQAYLEYETMRLIQGSIQESMSYELGNESGSLSYSMSIAVDMVLVQDIGR